MTERVTVPVAEADAASQREKLFLFAVTFACAFGLALALSWGNLADPFVRHDDYPTVFGEAEGYYLKTLFEGRWLNYWYIALPFTLPTEVSFVLYLTAWSLFSAAFAVHAFGPGSKVFPGLRLLLAGLIVLTPMQFDIAQWFNTVMPGIWVMAIYGVICVFVPRPLAIKLLFVFVPLAFSAYNTYPFYILALLLCRLDHKGTLRDLAHVVAVFIAAFAVAIALTYGLNWYYHGVFGIEVDEWREPNYARSLGGLIENLSYLQRSLFSWVAGYGMGFSQYGFYALSGSMLCALVVARMDDSLRVLYAFAPIVLGCGLLAFYSLQTGIFVPNRATVFCWLVSAYLVVVAVNLLGTTMSRRVALAGVVLLFFGFLSHQFVLRFEYLQKWQVGTHELAAQIPDESQRIVVFGPVATVKGARESAVQTLDALSYRLRYLTGNPVSVCRHPDTDCSEETPPFDPTPRFGSLLIETEDGVTYLRTPELDLPP